jgi:integrase
MATIQNRSRIVVSVKNRPSDTRYFPFNATDKAQAYVSELRKQGFRPKAKQEEDTWEVRIRQKGYPSQNVTFQSERDAKAFAAKLDSERSTGLIRDYTKARQVTFAHLLVRYMREFKKKSAQVIAYKIEAWLEDSGPDGQRLLADHREALAQAGVTVRQAKFKMRESIRNLEWIHKSLALVDAEDINGYIVTRQEQVSDATVDREVDTFSAVFRKATRSWGYHLADNPMGGVERPSYCNERERRFKAHEEERLFEAICKLDREHAVQAHIEALLASEFAEAEFTSVSAQKKVFAQRRDALRPVAERDAETVPRLEAFFEFLLMTGARRGEALSIKWSDIDFAAKTAYLAETKNGRPRKLSLRSMLIELLLSLPRTSEYVFAFGYSWLADMWRNACADAGIENLRMHDLRHEAISRVAETGAFELVDLQAFSGHRDLRMLLRYSHLCATRMANKLDEAFADAEKSIRRHKGRRLLKKGAGLSMRELIEAPDLNSPRSSVALKPDTDDGEVDEATLHFLQLCEGSSSKAPTDVAH